jgi:hypothetical protein
MYYSYTQKRYAHLIDLVNFLLNVKTAITIVSYYTSNAMRPEIWSSVIFTFSMSYLVNHSFFECLEATFLKAFYNKNSGPESTPKLQLLSKFLSLYIQHLKQLPALKYLCFSFISYNYLELSWLTSKDF